MFSDPLAFIQAWYQEHCDGDWEHQYGVEIGTLDNPGWRLEVDLVGTELEGRQMPRALEERDESDWIDSWSDGRKFQAAASANNLGAAIATFQAFASRSDAL